MANFSSRKDKKYNVDEIANQLIEQIKNNNVDSSKINIKNVNTKNNNTSLWDTVKDTADGLGKNADNLWQGLKNGILSFRQQIGRVTQDNATNRALNMQNNFLQEQLSKNPNDEKAKALLNNNTNIQNKSNKESEEYLVSLQEKMNRNSEKIIKNTESIDNPILKKTSELAPSIGQMLPGMIGGPAGAIYFTGSASGNYYNDAINRGMTKEQATMYSGTMGIIEGTLESIGAGLTKNVGKQLLKKNIKGALANYGLDVAENFLEESIVEPLSELAVQTYAGKDKANWKNIGQRMIESGVDGALVSAITGGISGTIGAVGSQIPKQNVYKDYYTNQKLDKSTQNVLKQAENIINKNNTLNSQPQSTQKQQILPTQQITQQENKIPQNGNMEQNIANNQETLYNNSNESESGINGREQTTETIGQNEQGRVKGLFPTNEGRQGNAREYQTNNEGQQERESDLNERNNGQIIGRNDETTRIYEKSEPQQTREYSWEEYNKWEQSIKPIETNKLTESQRKSVEYAKTEYNKEVILYNENENDNTYSGGASKEVKGKITISRQSADEFGLNKIIDHENLESDILHNENTRDILSDVIEMIQKDENFKLQKEEFWKGQVGNIPTDYLIAKDIVCDRFSEIKQKEKLDYENVLSNATKSTLDNALINYYFQVYGKELDIPSSFHLPTKQEVGNVPVKQNILPTKETLNEASINLPQNKNTKKVKFDSDNLIQEGNKMSEEETAQILTEIKGRTNEKRKMSAFLKANLIDKGMVFEELARKTNNRDLQGKYDYTLTAEARGQNAIGNARYDYQTTVENGKIKKGDKNAKQISKSLTDIINEVGEDPTDFYNYMYHQLNIDRMTLEERFGGDTGTNYERKNAIKNKPVFGKGITAEISQKYVQELEQKHPKFKEYAQDVYNFLDANTKELVDNGVISKETQQLFKEMYPHYVPISRITNKGQAINVPLDTGRTGVNSPIKRAKGGNRDINPLFQTMADRTLQTYRASARNNFGIELKNTLDKAKQLNQTTELTNIDSIMESMTDEEQNNNLLQEGVNGENPTFTVFENGEKVTYEISKDMYDALKPKNELLKRIDNSVPSKVLNKVNNFRRGLLTEYNPVFSITNAIKDAQDVLLNSEHSVKTYSKIPEATAQILSKGYWYKEYMQNGGEQNSYFRDGEFDVTKKTLPSKTKEVVTLPLKAISSVNNVIEMTPRLAEYIVSRQQGRSIETSMLDASRVTTNFKAGGDITKTLNRNGFTFLNASVQGMQQQIRNIQEANAKGLKGYAVLACKYAIAGVPVLLLNNLIWADDDEYDELQDYVKDNYYIIGKLSNGKFLRIPKGRAVATIQKIVSNANEFIKNDTINSDEVGKIFWEDMKENIKFARDNLAPNNPLENNILSPLVQVMKNKTWYGEDLVPTRLQNKPKEEQYDESTDKFSRWLGEKTRMSPIKINYLLDQYSGGAGDVLLPLGTPQAENNVIEDKFTTDSTMKSKYPGEFFSKVDELEINSNSSKATDEDILKHKYISSVSSEIGKLYKKKRDIQNSNETDEKKKSQLKEVQKQINEMAKNSLENVDKVTKGDKYAQIDKNQYYKDIEGEWQKVSDKEKEKNKKSELSLKTYSSYKYQMSKVKQQKVNNGEMTKDQSLKNDDKIQILLDSNYSDKEKSAIYENYIKTQTKKGEYDSFDVIKASNIDIDEYLKYEQQDFISDKKEDGTLDGKTVSKSKQKKVVQYLNSMKIEGNQRLLLYAMQGYTTNSSQKSQLAQYVYSLKLDKDTKLELYNKFSGFKVYKDGRVQW